MAAINHVAETIKFFSQKRILNHFLVILQIGLFYLAPALMQALLFGYAATYDVNHVDYAIL